MTEETATRPKDSYGIAKLAIEQELQICKEMFGLDYARTLSEWRRNFHAAWPRMNRLGFDEPFRRLWDYYLCYCETGFRSGSIDVGIFRFRRPD